MTSSLVYKRRAKKDKEIFKSCSGDEVENLTSLSDIELSILDFVIPITAENIKVIYSILYIVHKCVITNYTRDYGTGEKKPFSLFPKN